MRVERQVHVILLVAGCDNPVAVAGLCAFEPLGADQLCPLPNNVCRGAGQPVHDQL